MIVPTGYDGVITSNVNSYTGQNFQEGSGDIHWRIKLNQRYVPYYGDITTSIGSLTTPYTVNNGSIRVQSRQVITYIAELGAGALGNLTGGRIVCSLFGWTYPR